MADETQSTGTVPRFCCDPARYPPSCGVLYSQHFGLPPLLDPRDLGWVENLFRKLGSSSWPGYSRTSRTFSSRTVHRELSEGLSEIYIQETKWTISLDVNHFAPTDITVRTHSGFLLVEGKHEERQDEHGYISRSFVRKYKLPVGIIIESIQSCISGDGILTVEAQITSFPPPADITVSVQVDTTTVEDTLEDGLQREGLVDGGVASVTDSGAAQPLIPPRPDGKPEDESVDQRTQYDEKLRPSGLSAEGEQEPVPVQTTEDQHVDLSEEQRVLIQKKEDELKTEEDLISEQKVEEAGEAAQEVQEPSAHRPGATQVLDAATTQQEDLTGAVPEGETQKPEADGQVQLGEADGQVQLGEGQVQKPEADGQVQLGEADGQAQLGDGQVQLGDGQVQLGDGQVQLGDGQVQLGDGQVQLGDGQVQLGDGQVQFHDGQVQLGEADGQVQEPEADGQVQLGEAEHERVGTEQTLEEIQAHLELQQQLMMEENLRTKLAEK
ncbi:heat shock protein 67B1 isoform X1 [Astyanax mexicanus]|uniref:heat shock protein 67B1 isoform X1 n=1 Tax=Astyanax mexicanus TaxID=7994 RepID=UPI0020CB626F|nr:heat shock protein 67B1 isoform X1 [Astyanax mexicanus]